MNKAIADGEAHKEAQVLITSASGGNATFANLGRLVELVQKASGAESVAIANMFLANMGTHARSPLASASWDRTNLIPFEGLTNLLAWREVRDEGMGHVITMSHAFSAVSMPRLPSFANTIVNHPADGARGVTKGVPRPHGHDAHLRQHAVGGLRQGARPLRLPLVRPGTTPRLPRLTRGGRAAQRPAQRPSATPPSGAGAKAR
jgi:hypothetical protein